MRRTLPWLCLLLCGCDLFAAPEGSPDAGIERGRDGGSEPEGDGGGGGELLRERVCGGTVSYRPEGPVGSVTVAGSWDGFVGRTPLEDPDGDGTYAITLPLDPGLYAYKLVVDDQWILDPSHRYRAYDGGVENSGLRVPDCHAPLLELTSHDGTRAGADRGSARMTIRYTEGAGASGPDADGFTLELRTGQTSRPLGTEEWTWDASTWELAVSLEGLTDGKYTLKATALNADGAASNTLLLPFWIEAEAFDWRDGLIYMIVTDRYRNGDPGNDGAAAEGAVTTADFSGGDLAGITQSIREGTLDDLGVRALWITPWYQNPVGTFADGDGTHRVTGYHGYWPVEPRAVDPRLGGDEALHELSEVAHEHGIRLLMDLVINHVHEQHPYYGQHGDWFHTIESSCQCGSDGCDWTARRLDCLFQSYMPDIAWENNEASEAFLADALYWLEEFDLDGLRVDAVKHVPDGAIFNLGTLVAENFETAGTDYFLMGETAMGWYDCDPSQPDCNAENYGTISRYVGQDALDGQFDFVLYHGAALKVFASGERGMVHARVWTEASQSHYPQGAIMTPYIGSHDTARFLSYASSPALTGNKWPEQTLPTAPDSDEPYDRLGLALTWNLTIPGAPLLYYGDEYGEYGGADPDNRHAIRFEADRSPREQALYRWISAVGRARRELPALRRGALATLENDEDFWAFVRRIPATQEQAIVVLNRSATEANRTLLLGATYGVPAGTVLEDRISGATVTITDGQTLPISVPAFGAAIFAPRAVVAPARP